MVATKENTSQKLFAIIQTKIEKFPYAEENDEYMPSDFLRVYSESTEADYDEAVDLTFERWDELVTLIFERRRVSPPIPVRPFSEMMGTEAECPDGGLLLIDSVGSYLYCYGLDVGDLYWVRKVPTYAAFFPSAEEAKDFMLKQGKQLREPRVEQVKMGVLLK